jgi:murein DD-endopeptidase MepM/ murein hydrolase activator NlpD
MKQFFQKLFFPAIRVKTIAALILLAAATAALLGMQIHRSIIRSRTVTQATIAEGWKAAGFELTEHRIRQKENFWKVAKIYGVDIDAIVGANPGLGKLNASLNQAIRVPNRRGVVHRIEDNERADTIAELYRVPVEAIVSLNNLGPKHILTPGLELFIPGAKPVKLTGEMAAHYGLRGIFGSPLPGRVTSGMGRRTHPVGGFRGRHTGVDLAAKDGTSIAAAASGTVAQTGEGEYIGNFVILSHQDGYTTIYGHCSQILTMPGRTVKKGQIIAKSGHTGRVTGPHLHFEIRKQGIPQDPMKYLW